MKVTRLIAVAVSCLLPALASAATRTDVITYEDNLGKWVLGQPKSSTNLDTGLVESRTDYDPATALPTQTHSFGALQASFSHWPDGQLRTTTDANGNTTFLGDYYRGIPRLIGFADGRRKTAGVNALGQIDWVVDEVGAKTCYAYDLGGRLAQTIWPSEQTPNACDTSWAPMTMSFTQSRVDRLGLAAGHWVQQTRTGAGVTNTYFDALWRPVIEETYDENAVGDTLSQTVTRYDASGQVVFKSYPMRGVGHYAAVTQGVRSSYDALGRIVRTEQDSELGVLTSTNEYLAGFMTRTTNARGYSTVQQYLAFDVPSTAWPTGIVEPEDTATEIHRDLFGKPLMLRRRNGSGSVFVDRHYAYDDAQRLCATIEPETAGTVHGYDAAGNLAWSASGVPLQAGADCASDRAAALASGRVVHRAYDQRNRQVALTFPDGHGDQVLAYTADGLLATATTFNDAGQASPVVNTYAYNQRRLLVEEHSAQPGFYDWGLQYGYDSNGFRSSQRFPDGATLRIGLNALGQATSLSDHAGSVYARDVAYFPNGAIRRFVYGNGITHDMAQNTRQLPGYVNDYGVAATMYSYDANGNPTAIRDVNATQHVYTGNRDLAYDGRDRLAHAHLHWWLIDDYTYDALDNITSKLRTTGAGATARTYVYDAANRLTNLLDGATGASLTGLGYDAQGNLANKDGQRYRFDHGNRLRRVDGKGAYRYDAHGRRVLASGATRSVVSMYDRDGSLAHDLDYATNKTTDYIHLSGSLVATREVQDGNATTKFHHTDALGSPIAVTDQAGRLIDRTHWEPYGAALNNASYQGVGYTGHVMDGATGLTYMQQRYYDPGIARFLSVDPISASDAGEMRLFNRYAYAFNNPYRFTDPDGRAPCETCDQVMERLFPQGDIFRTAGTAIATDVAYVVGAVTGNDALQHAAIEGFQERVGTKDGVLTAASLALSPRGGIKEGIYEFPDAKGGNKPYVGQSGNLEARLAAHEESGRLVPGTATTTEVKGGKTSREVAEHQRIQQITGGTPASKSDAVSNKVDPIGPARKHLLEDQ